MKKSLKILFMSTIISASSIPLTASAMEFVNKSAINLINKDKANPDNSINSINFHKYSEGEKITIKIIEQLRQFKDCVERYEKEINGIKEMIINKEQIDFRNIKPKYKKEINETKKIIINEEINRQQEEQQNKQQNRQQNRQQNKQQIDFKNTKLSINLQVFSNNYELSKHFEEINKLKEEFFRYYAHELENCDDPAEEDNLYEKLGTDFKKIVEAIQSLGYDFIEMESEKFEDKQFFDVSRLQLFDISKLFNKQNARIERKLVEKSIVERGKYLNLEVLMHF